jgi:hypothetical protein
VKELTKKILEAGLVDKHLAQMMEKWGALEPGATDLVGRKQVTKETLEEFAKDIEEMVRVDQPSKETILDLEIKEPTVFLVVGRAPFYGAWDEIGHLLVGTKVLLDPGDMVVETQHGGESKKFTILEVTPVYIGEQRVGQLATVESL